MTFLFEDRLIRQAINSKNEIYTIRKRLPKDTPEYIKLIQDWAKKHNGLSVRIVMEIKKHYNISLSPALQMFKDATGITDLNDRHQRNYHARQMVKG